MSKLETRLNKIIEFLSDNSMLSFLLLGLVSLASFWIFMPYNIAIVPGQLTVEAPWNDSRNTSINTVCIKNLGCDLSAISIRFVDQSSGIIEIGTLRGDIIEPANKMRKSASSISDKIDDLNGVILATINAFKDEGILADYALNNLTSAKSCINDVEDNLSEICREIPFIDNKNIGTKISFVVGKNSLDPELDELNGEIINVTNDIILIYKKAGKNKSQITDNVSKIEECKKKIVYEMGNINNLSRELKTNLSSIDNSLKSGCILMLISPGSIALNHGDTGYFSVKIDPNNPCKGEYRGDILLEGRRFERDYAIIKYFIVKEHIPVNISIS